MNIAAQPIEWPEVKRVVDELRNAGDWEDLLLFGIATHTALRCSDWQKLTWGDFIANGKCIDKYTPREQKTQKKRKIPLGKTIREVIEFAFEKSPCKRPDGYMFLSKRGRRAPGGGITTDGGNIRLKRILARFGMAGFTTHSMRKACATNAFNEWGGDFQALLLVKEMLQHSSIDTTVRYIGLNDSRINEFYNAL